ncbi:MAG TPA: hypothetical protein VGY99_10360 [Candidatus Binataceae bacterium]|jgi:hypothetical protein|nr:hypothetical protein [Candidatus Binataceae bacterium]
MIFARSHGDDVPAGDGRRVMTAAERAELRDEVTRWLFFDPDTGPASLAFACVCLGLHAGALRERLWRKFGSDIKARSVPGMVELPARISRRCQRSSRTTAIRLDPTLQKRIRQEG